MTTAARLLALFTLALAAGHAPLRAQSTPQIPGWLSPYPGASGQTRQLGPVAESNYSADARPGDVLAHYRQLFQAAGKPFRPSPGGNGFTIRGVADDCDLFIRIRRTESGSAVQTTCSIGVTGVGHTERVLDQAAADSRTRMQSSMEKYDQPVYPTPKSALPAPVWPPWLIRIDGAAFQPTRGADTFGYRYLRAAFIGANSRNELQSFYAELLSANGYPIASKSLSATPATRKAWVEGRRYTAGEDGPRMVIRIELTPVEQGTSVDLRMTSRR